MWKIKIINLKKGCIVQAQQLNKWLSNYRMLIKLDTCCIPEEKAMRNPLDCSSKANKFNNRTVPLVKMKLQLTVEKPASDFLHLENKIDHLQLALQKPQKK